MVPVKPRELPELNPCRVVVNLGRFLGGQVITERPVAQSSLIPLNSLVVIGHLSNAFVATHWRPVHQVLLVGAYPEIAAAVIQAVTIDMINLHPYGSWKDGVVHPYVFTHCLTIGVLLIFLHKSRPLNLGQVSIAVIYNRLKAAC